jgi:hypothetical protein
LVCMPSMLTAEVGRLVNGAGPSLEPDI